MYLLKEVLKKETVQAVRFGGNEYIKEALEKPYGDCTYNQLIRIAHVCNLLVTELVSEINSGAVEKIMAERSKD